MARHLARDLLTMTYKISRTVLRFVIVPSNQLNTGKLIKLIIDLDLVLAKQILEICHSKQETVIYDGSQGKV